MAPKFRKKDRVKVLATRFDKEEVEEGERKFSEKWAADGNGIWCYGTITHVYVKKRRQAQEYMIRYDNAESMRGVEEHIETAQDEGESDNDSEEAKDNMDRDSDNASTDMELDAVVRAQLQDNDNEVTDDEAGEVCEGEENEMTEGVAMGETVTKGDDDDPKKKTWTRIAALPTDPRTEERQETTFKNLRIHDDTTELDIFLALLPLSPETLLQIVRDGGDRTNCKYKWNLEHILSALCIIFGAGQFKEGTDLWSVKRKGMMPGPDFGLYLSRDRFEKILRFWAYGPDGTEAKLPENPWE